MVVLLLTKNYYLYFAITIVFTIIECLWIYIVAKKKYPEIDGPSQPLDNETKKVITKNVAALSMHKIGSSVVLSTDNILISSFLGVVLLGAYSNYFMIISALTSVYLMPRVSRFKAVFFVSILTTALRNSIREIPISVRVPSDRPSLISRASIRDIASL